MENRDELLVKVATLYYEEGVTQTALAKTLHLSRPTIAALLKEAKDKGIVRITIQHSGYGVFQLQEKIRKRYGLKHVLIARHDASSKVSSKTLVGQLCAQLIEELLPQINTLGIGWGTTVYEYVDQASFLHADHLKIIPLLGGVGLSDVKYHANHLAFTLAQKYSCDVSYFYAPAIAESKEMKDAFLQSVLIRQTLREGKATDLAVLGIGNPIQSSTYRSFGYIAPDDLQDLIDHEAIGDIGSTFFNKSGKAIRTDISERMIGISLQDLHRHPSVMVLATGKEKAESIKALLKEQVIDHLIIDQSIADLL